MRFYFTIWIIILSPLRGHSQNSFQQDSTDIVNHCQQILLTPQKADSIFGLLQEINNANSTIDLQDVFYYNYAKVLFQIGKTDSAYQTSLLGLSLFKDDTLAYKASKHHNIIGAVYSFKNEYPQAISAFTKAVSILEHHNDIIKAALVKSNIANLFFSLSDYQSAYNYSNQSLSVLNANNDTLNSPAITAIVAISALKLGKIDEGAKLTETSISLSNKYNNPVGLIVSFLSKGEWKYLTKDYLASKEAYLKSLKYAMMYRQNHYILLDNIGLLKAELQLKNYDSAVQYGLSALTQSEKLSNGNTRYAILKNLSYAYAGQQKFKEAMQYMDSAHNLYISTANTENQAKINELLIQYESEKNERALISSQLETASQKIQVHKRNNWIAGLLGFIAMFFILYWFYRRRQSQKIVLLKQIAEKNELLAAIEGEEKERERFANELHDGIASALTGIRLKLEQNKLHKNNDEIIEHLKNLQEDTRRISHNLMPLSLHKTSLEEAIANYVNENTTTNTVITYYKLNKTPLSVSPAVKNTLYRICQELIQNVLKHANSSTCTIQTSDNQNGFEISIEDEGCGFDYSQAKQTQGLKSINKRLLSIGGHLHIESKSNEGTLVIIRLNKTA